MNNINPLFLTDFYKFSHVHMYPQGTNMVFSNLTARSAKLKNIPDAMWTGRTVFFGLQYFIKKLLIEDFNQNFFNRPEDIVVDEYARRIRNSLGPDHVKVDHVRALHRLGYLPIAIDALPEGSLVNIGVPYLTIYNTHPDFYWLVNYLETILSATLWKPIVSATTAFHYRKYLDDMASNTGVNQQFVQWQGHDFSARGMSGGEDMALSGAAHLTSFSGTDTVSAIDLVERYYDANGDKELIGGSVPASEHSVVSSVGPDGELDNYYRRMITEVYPKGIVSLVSDTYDFFRVITEYMPSLRDVIMQRDGKVVLRPDSGDPLHILCGDPSAPEGSNERKGAVQLLWEIFGGTINSSGFKELDPHIGLIYGDSITPQRCKAIIDTLAAAGFASTNVVFGIGSYTYNFCTRDTYGIAVKATYCEINNTPQLIFKDPATDKDKFKKSLRGCMMVTGSSSNLEVQDGLNFAEYQKPFNRGVNRLQPVFLNGILLQTDTLKNIRERIAWASHEVATMVPGGSIASAAVSGPTS